MKIIYPEKTLALLAQYDEIISEIVENYQQTYPEPPAFLREVLGEQGYAEKYHAVISQRRRAMLENPTYQACIKQKARIVSLSTFTVELDSLELAQMRKTSGE